MNYEKDERFVFIMAALAEASGQELSEMKVRIYAKALEDLPIADIERAAWEIIKTRKFATFPKVAEIREAIHGNPEDRAIIALDKLEKAMREVGGYQSVCFDDPVIHMAVDSFSGGWPAICNMPHEEWKWARKEFVTLYQTFTHQPKHEVAPRLTGIHEHTNRLNGHAKPVEVVYIGTRPKVAEIERENKNANKIKNLLVGVGG